MVLYKHFKISLLVIFSAFFLSSCAEKTQYQSLEDAELASTFSPKDQEMMVASLIKKFQANSNIVNIASSKPSILIQNINNQSSEHINTTSITDSLKVRMNNQGYFSFINRDNTELLKQEAIISANNSLSTQKQATALGKLWSVNYVMYGNFSSIKNYLAKQKQTTYKLTMTIQDIESGIEVWSDEVQINKVTK